MKPRDIIFAAIVITVVGGLYLLSTRARAPKPMPANAAHQSASTRDQCLGCHQAEKLADLEKAHRHPGKWRDVKVSCLQCHTTTQSAPARAGTNTDQATGGLLAHLKTTSSPSPTSPR
ncbi:MAG TPA: hypothetical protein VFD58_17160 [Blastocatellia bacterium]|nr:hypothetical protein [Blastocatellia bacterium]